MRGRTSQPPTHPPTASLAAASCQTRVLYGSICLLAIRYAHVRALPPGIHAVAVDTSPWRVADRMRGVEEWARLR
eukprot:6191778-Pleurochrysis_carterae.AAC.1